MGKVAEELLNIFTYMGLPKEMLIDQGSNFMAQVFKEACAMLTIWHLRTSIYHSQTNGLVKWFKWTLKIMLKKVAR